MNRLSFLLILIPLLLANCTAYQVERTRRQVWVIENDIRILVHAGHVLDTVYTGGRRRPNIIRGVERARKGDKLARRMLPDMLQSVQTYLRQVPRLHTDVPEAASYRVDRQRLLASTDPGGSIEIYRKLRADIDRTVGALRARKQHLAGKSADKRKDRARAGTNGARCEKKECTL